jgi:hypothetical protein
MAEKPIDRWFALGSIVASTFPVAKYCPISRVICARLNPVALAT